MHMIELASGKKRYVKPDAQLVDFSLSSNIAGSCGAGAGQDLNGWGTVLLTETCGVNTGDSDFCYNVPTEDSSVFTS